VVTEFPGPQLNTYTNAELDQLAGSMLAVGTWNGALGLMLDVTSDWSSFDLFEFVNHLPVEPAADILATVLFAAEEVKVRLEVLIRSVNAAIDSAAERAAGALAH